MQRGVLVALLAAGIASAEPLLSRNVSSGAQLIMAIADPSVARVVLTQDITLTGKGAHRKQNQAARPGRTLRRTKSDTGAAARCFTNSVAAPLQLLTCP